MNTLFVSYLLLVIAVPALYAVIRTAVLHAMRDYHREQEQAEVEKAKWQAIARQNRNPSEQKTSVTQEKDADKDQ